MLKSLIHASVQQRVVALLITAAVALTGFFAFQRTPVEAFPDVTNLQVNVIALAPGLAPEEVERQVTIPLERALNGIPRARLLRSESLFGLSLIWIVFEDNADSFRSRTFVMERLMGADLPEGASVEIAPDYTPLGKVLHYRVRSELRDPTALRSLQTTTIERSLRAVPGVADVIGFGGFLKELHVEVSPEDLERHELTLQEVHDAIAQNNLSVAGGVLRQGDQEYIVRSVGTIADVQALRKVPVRVEEDGVLTLGQIARIWQSHTPRRGSVSADLDDEIVEGVILMRRGENPNLLLKRIHAEIDALNAGGLPSDVTIEPMYDRSVMLSRTLSTVYTNLWHGAVLIIAVCWLFLRILRGALIVCVVIPLSLLTAFIGLYAIGLPANLISMGAIDFGILVDGAVVLVENIQRRLRDHRPATREQLRELVTGAALEVARPTFFALSIIIAAMLPIFALESVEGRMFRPLALTYVFALIGALVFSLTAIPALCAVALRPRDAEVQEPKTLVKMQGAYRRALDFTLPRPWLPTLAALLTLVVAFVGARSVGSEFLPELDEGDIYIFAEAPTSISLEHAAENFSKIRKLLLEFEQVELVLAEQGRPEDGTDNEGPNLAKIFVRLTPRETWPKGLTKDAIIEEMRSALHAVPGLTYNFSQPIKDSVEEAVAGVRGDVVLKARGSDLTQLRETLLQAKELIADVEGVRDLDLYRDAIVPQLTIQLLDDALVQHGVQIDDAQHTIRMALAGEVATSIWEGELAVPIRVLLQRDARLDIESIGALQIPTMSGGTIALSSIAELQVQTSQASIPREMNQRYLALKFNVDGRDAGSVVRDAIDVVNAGVEVPEDMVLQWGGEFENQQRAMARLSIVIPLALAIVFVLLLIAIRSWSASLIVFACMPLGLSGGVFGLVIAGESLSVSAAVGFIALIGQVSLLGLLMLTPLTEQLRSGTRAAASFLDEASERMRPLLMTALLASLGLLPMAMSTGMGSETQRPFAAVIVAGMVTTLATALFVMPLLFTRFHAPLGTTAAKALNEEAEQ